jgi:hypothetical protein
VILYLQDPKKSIKKLLDFIQTFSKVAGYKINSRASAAFLHIINEQLEKEIRRIIPFTIASKQLNYTRINLTMGVTDLYNENYK